MYKILKIYLLTMLGVEIKLLTWNNNFSWIVPILAQNRYSSKKITTKKIMYMLKFKKEKERAKKNSEGIKSKN